MSHIVTERILPIFEEKKLLTVSISVINFLGISET